MSITKAEANRINGRKGGRPKGRKNDKTIEREAAKKAYDQMVLQKLEPVFQSQLVSALGVYFVYRKEHYGTGASKRIEHIQLTEPYEIADALDRIANGENGFSSEEGFCYVMAKGPGDRAIDSMLDRAIGKATTVIATEDAEGKRLPITGVDITVRK